MQGAHRLPELLYRVYPAICLFILVMTANHDLEAVGSQNEGARAAGIIAKMKAAYANLTGIHGLYRV